MLPDNGTKADDPERTRDRVVRRTDHNNGVHFSKHICVCVFTDSSCCQEEEEEEEEDELLLLTVQNNNIYLFNDKLNIFLSLTISTSGTWSQENQPSRFVTRIAYHA